VVAAVAVVAAAVVAAVVVVAAAVVAEEVHAAGVPPRIHATKFISQWRARSVLPSGLFSFRMGYFETNRQPRFST